MKNAITNDRIFNFDETGVSTVMESPKVMAARGTKQEAQVTSAERGSQISLGVFVTTEGNVLPPVYILPSRLERSRTANIFDNKGNLIGAPENSLGCFSDYGGMTSECFLQTLHATAF